VSLRAFHPHQNALLNISQNLQFAFRDPDMTRELEIIRRHSDFGRIVRVLNPLQFLPKRAFAVKKSVLMLFMHTSRP
jgi:hypothetical protein